jgi:hypothetical protein
MPFSRLLIHGRDHGRGAGVQHPRGGRKIADGNPDEGGLSGRRDERDCPHRGREFGRTMLQIKGDRVELFPRQKAGQGWLR